MNLIPEVIIGDKVRSYHFDDSVNYLVGIVKDIEFVEGCDRYVIEVTQDVRDGVIKDVEPYLVYPPLNGTQKLLGGRCYGVEPIREDKDGDLALVNLVIDICKREIQRPLKLKTIEGILGCSNRDAGFIYHLFMREDIDRFRKVVLMEN